MNELTILILALCVMLLVMVMIMVGVKKELKKYVQIMCGTTTDIAVDEFFRKAVIIAIDSYSKDNKPAQEITELVVERASGIVSDVLLQHGMKPRDFNLPGLCKVQLYKMGFLRHRKAGDFDGKG